MVLDNGLLNVIMVYGFRELDGRSR